jgi:hypothetical protein
MAKKPDANDVMSSKSVAETQLELATFINALPVETKAAWRDLIPVRKEIKGAGWLKERHRREIYEWAQRNLFVEPCCKYLLEKFKS